MMIGGDPIYHPLLKGAIDLHCHCAPSLYPRKQTDWELVRDLKASGMAGAVIKSHESQTVDRTALIRMAEPELHVYGGLVCNEMAGGLSPASVEAAIKLGAKIIWMPTVSARAHRSYYSRNRSGRIHVTAPVRQRGPGLEIWDENRRILPEVHEILRLIAEADVVLATGHLSPGEVYALAKAAGEHGVAKLLIQHADLGIAPIPLEMQRELVRGGALIEKCYLACGADFRTLTVEEMGHTIRVLDPASCVLVTDYGQAHNPPPVEALSRFVGEIARCGFSDEEIRRMIVHNPRQLLGID